MTHVGSHFLLCSMHRPLRSTAWPTWHRGRADASHLLPPRIRASTRTAPSARVYVRIRRLQATAHEMLAIHVYFAESAVCWQLRRDEGTRKRPLTSTGNDDLLIFFTLHVRLQGRFRWQGLERPPCTSVSSAMKYHVCLQYRWRCCVGKALCSVLSSHASVPNGPLACSVEGARKAVLGP